MEPLTVQWVLMVLFAFVIANTVHEFSHALAATALGDDTPRREGRLTINPIDHLDPLGTAIVVISALMGGLFGWGRPVPVNASNFRNPRAGLAITTAAGPASNLVLAAICAGCLRTNALHLPFGSPYATLLWVGVQLNLVLCLFNLIPVPPLDGARILASVLPESASRAYIGFMNQFGMIAVMLVMFGGWYLIAGPLQLLGGILLGH